MTMDAFMSAVLLVVHILVFKKMDVVFGQIRLLIAYHTHKTTKISGSANIPMPCNAMY
jgi:hypothetical protein